MAAQERTGHLPGLVGRPQLTSIAVPRREAVEPRQRPIMRNTADVDERRGFREPVVQSRY